MLAIHVDNLSDLTVVECRGRILREESVSSIRDVVLSQTAATSILLDLSEVRAIGTTGLEMLAFLNHWAREQNIDLKLYSPSKAVLDGLVRSDSIHNFELVSFHELQVMMRTESHYPVYA
jgi:anti-anti-sigma regulatory factor